MQLTRKEISETQVIVTTPEKWAVVTNKSSSEEELTSVCPVAPLRFFVLIGRQTTTESQTLDH